MNVYHHTLDLNWQMVRLICAIERFDACWPAMERREGAMLKVITIGAQDAGSILDQKLEEVPELRFWYETDIDTPPVVKCAVFCAEYGNQFAASLLQKQGYRWVIYTNLQEAFSKQPSEYTDLTEQVVFFLTCLRDAQEHLLQRLEVHGVEQTLSHKEKQLLHIIENHPGIKTNGISKKLGVSNSTVKRMLDRLITNKLITRQGIGPGSYYTLL